jgi:hemolysin activation/secretion protein
LSGDLTVVPVLHAGDTPGTVDLDLKVQDRLPLHGSVELNNAHTPDTEPLRIATSLSYDNVGQLLDSVSLQYQLAPQSPSNVEVVAGTFVFRFAQIDPALTVYAIDTKSDVATIGTLSVLGSGDIFGSRLIWTLSSSASRTETVSLGADYKKFRDNINVTESQTVATNVDYVPFTVSYSLNRIDPQGSTAVSAGLTWALRGLVSSSQAFNLSRADAPSDFIYLRASVGRTQELPFGLSTHVQLDGQASPGPLISNEQFSIGGAQSVRGYYEAEELGDSGIRGSVELRSPLLQRPTWGAIHLYGYGFYDWAAIELHDPLPSQASRATLRSTGVGFRLNSFQHLDANLDWAYVLEDGLRTDSGQTRYNFSVRYGF